ncbi:hypothetical protein M758_UG091500 [Ceratodon purpureus]|nr:hypothetical protein M758_UG091500 [Ceratodon purpureus]
MAPLTGTDSSPTFSSSQGESSLYDSGDSLHVVQYAGVPCSHFLSHILVYNMSTPRGHGLENFPPRRLHSDDMGPCSGNLPHPSQAMYEDFDREIFDEEFGDDLQDSEYGGHGLANRNTQDVDHIRGRGTPHTDWDGNDTLGTYNMQRPASNNLTGTRRHNSVYAAMSQGYGQGIPSPTEQECRSSMIRGESSQPQSDVP